MIEAWEEFENPEKGECPPLEALTIELVNQEIHACFSELQCELAIAL
jgi:hypothetical protein